MGFLLLDPLESLGISLRLPPSVFKLDTVSAISKDSAAAPQSATSWLSRCLSHGGLRDGVYRDCGFQNPKICGFREELRDLGIKGIGICLGMTSCQKGSENSQFLRLG